MNKKRFTEIFLLSIFGAIVILPGFFFWDITGHELYHSYKNKQYVEKLCINYNYPYTSHVVINFPDDKAREDYNIVNEEKEEEIANRIGRIAAITYVVLVISLFAWVINFSKRIDGRK